MYNIGYTGRIVAYGNEGVHVWGGVEKKESLGIARLALLKPYQDVITNLSESRGRSLDRERDGFVLGDRAGVLILE